MARKFKTPITLDELGSASSQAIAANVDGDTQNRINIDAGGKITWGSGSATGDTTLYRSAADTLKTDDAFTATSLAVTGQFTLPTADGSASQVLQTNGSGTISWTDITAYATVSDTAPSSPSAGQIWYESDTGKTFVYYDSFWIEVGASPPASPFITDLDEDTKIQVEESADEDKIRFDTAGSERMIIDASGNVGIGTTSPSTALEVSSNTGGGTTSTDLRISSTGQSSTWSTSNAWGVLDFYNADGSGGGAKSHASLRVISNDALGQDSDLQFHVTDHSATDITAMTIQGGTGNVGIGTSSPGAPLHLFGAGNAVDQIRISSTGGTVSEYGFLGADASTNVMRYGYWTGSGFGNHHFEGNVGIGTTSPSEKLDINAGTSGSVELTTTGGRTIQLTANDSEPFLSVGSTSAHSAAIMTNGVRRLTITSSGNVGIGTTSPSRPLDVASGGANFNGYVTVNSYISVARAGGSGNTLVVQNSSPVGSGVVRGVQVELGPDGNEDYTDSGDDFIRFITSNNQEIGGIRGTGAASVSYGTTSDYRLKAPIEEISDGLSLVRNLAPMYGKWLNQNDPDRIYSYFIAHELQEHVPDAVDGVKDAVDDEGEPDYQSVDYGKLTPVLTAAIKELDGLVQTLTARIEALEAG